MTAGGRLKPRSKYLSLFVAAAQRAVAYRQSILIGVVANSVWVIIPYFLWQAIFTETPQVGTFDWERMRTYIVLAYAINILLSFGVEARMMYNIRNGDVATELMRPIDYLKAQFAEASGAAVTEAALAIPLVLVFGVVVIHILPPASLLYAILFIISVALGYVVKFLISYMTGLICFWTLNALGLLWTRAALTNIFSGAFIPLSFLPGVLQTAALILPFQAIVYTPIRIYFGELAGGDLALAVGVQLFWCIALWLLARVVWRPSIKALTVQGG